MARRLGELLVAKGKLSNEQLQKALQAQMIWGGHLGTNLIELGYVTEDELGEILAEAHSVKYAPYDMLQEIPSSVLASVPRGLVEKYKIVPFRFDGKKLHLVMLTPQDLMALDEVSFATGFQLVPYVTPEIRLFQILEKYYSIPRAKRYITLSREMGLRGRDRTGAQSASRPVAADKSRPSASILEPEPSARPREKTPPAAAAAGGDGDGDYGAEDEAGAYRATRATEWSPRQTERAASPPAVPRAVELVPEPVDEGAEAERSEAGLDRLLKAGTLEEVCSALIEEAAGTLRRCAVFARSGEAFVSVAGLAASSPSWSIEGLTLPLPPPAIDALFAEGRSYYLGPPLGGAGEVSFYEKMGSGLPPNTLLAPIRLSDRIALVFYGDHIDEEIRPREVDELLNLLQQAGLALDLLALRRKDSPA